jgi:hypothetical protein
LALTGSLSPPQSGGHWSISSEGIFEENCLLLGFANCCPGRASAFVGCFLSAGCCSVFLEGNLEENGRLLAFKQGNPS